MTENRMAMNSSDLDGFDKRKLPSPGFQVEIVLADYNGSVSPRPSLPSPNNEADQPPTPTRPPAVETGAPPPSDANIETRNKDDVFSDSDAEDEAGSTSRHRPLAATAVPTTPHVISAGASETEPSWKYGLPNITHGIKQASLKAEGATMAAAPAASVPRTEESKSSSAFQTPGLESTSTSEFKAIAADASVFSFGDEDYESE